MNDLGIVSVLPTAMYPAFAFLILAFCLALWNNQPPWQLSVYVGLLIVMVFGLTALTETTPRFNATWKHIGVTDYILRNGQVDPTIDAYFNWPGFFILSAFVTKAMGLKSLLALTPWAPVLLNALYLGPLLMIFRTMTNDRRLIWLSVWCFLLGNWIGQDYFSPQGFSFFLWLVLVAVLLRWFDPNEHGLSLVSRFAPIRAALSRLPQALLAYLDAPSRAETPITGSVRFGLMALVIGLFVVINSSHQLTPFIAVLSVTSLVVFNRCSLRWLPVLMVILIVAWLQGPAAVYWSGHGGQILSDVGNIVGALRAGAADRARGSPEHIFVVQVRSAAALAFWSGALVGAIRRARAGKRDLSIVLLALTPFALIGAQSYGGEMLLRVYFFSLPFMAFFFAASIFPTSAAGRLRWTPIILVAMSLILLGSQLIGRYGNERMEVYTEEEVAATDYLYETADDGSLFLSVHWNLPWKHREYEAHDHRSLLPGETVMDVEWVTGTPPIVNAKAIADAMREANSSSYFIVTRSQVAATEILGGSPVSPAEVERVIRASSQFRVVFENNDAVIFVPAPSQLFGSSHVGMSKTRFCDQSLGDNTDCHDDDQADEDTLW